MEDHPHNGITADGLESPGPSQVTLFQDGEDDDEVPFNYPQWIAKEWSKIDEKLTGQPLEMQLSILKRAILDDREDYFLWKAEKSELENEIKERARRGRDLEKNVEKMTAEEQNVALRYEVARVRSTKGEEVQVKTRAESAVLDQVLQTLTPEERRVRLQKEVEKLQLERDMRLREQERRQAILLSLEEELRGKNQYEREQYLRKEERRLRKQRAANTPEYSSIKEMIQAQIRQEEVALERALQGISPEEQLFILKEMVKKRIEDRAVREEEKRLLKKEREKYERHIVRLSSQLDNLNVHEQNITLWDELAAFRAATSLGGLPDL